MADTVIFAEQTLTFSVQSGIGQVEISPAPFVLVEGETYRVVLDGTEYELVCELVDGIPSIHRNVTDESGDATDGTFAIQYGSPEIVEVEGGLVVVMVIDSTEVESHTLAIYQVIEAETTDGASIVLKDRNGEDVTYTGIKTVTFDTPTEGEQVTFTLGVEQTGKEVELALADGDQQVKADDGKLLKELTIKKPETLVPENIRNGENVGGVVGEFIGDTEEAAVVLSMADGDQVVEPSAEGKVLSKLTITKPETLVPENIAAGVDIAGIIGTLTGSGDGPKVISKSFTGSYSGTVTLFTADELAQIGFADATKKLVLMISKYQSYCYDSSIRTLLANLISSTQLTAGGGKSWGMSLYAYQSSGYSTPATGNISSNPFGTARTDTMYYLNGEILYNISSSLYKMSEHAASSALGYYLFAVVYD